jgi:hypothetical protein
MPYKQGSKIRSIVTRHNGNRTALDRLDNHTCISCTCKQACTVAETRETSKVQGLGPYGGNPRSGLLLFYPDFQWPPPSCSHATSVSKQICNDVPVRAGSLDFCNHKSPVSGTPTMSVTSIVL